MLFSTHRKKITFPIYFSCLVATFKKLFENLEIIQHFLFGVSALLLLRKSIYIFVTLQKKFCSHYSKQEANQVHSIKFEKAGMVTFLLNITTHVMYEKYATWSPDVVVVLIIGVF